MHSLVRRFLKTGIAFLGTGLALGLWVLVDREWRQRAPSPFVVSAHAHAILVGFVMMMILGVALWLFPRPAREDVRYSPRAAEAAWWLLTVGTGVRILGEVMRQLSASPLLRASIIVAACMQVGGLALFFHTMWSRIRPLGSQAREAQGERF